MLSRTLYASQLELNALRYISSTSAEDLSVVFNRRLKWLLRHGAVPPTLTLRPDGFARVDDIRRLPLFRKFTPIEFDDFLAEDQSQFFKITQEYDHRTGHDSFWIRARTGHTIKSIDWSVRRLHSPENVPPLVCPLDPETWAYAQHYGIPPETDGLIRLRAISAKENFDTNHVFAFLDVNKMLASRIPLWRSMRSRMTWLTTGDPTGVLPPEMFLDATQYEVDRQTLISVPENVQSRAALPDSQVSGLADELRDGAVSVNA
ncbi:hypothetical protein R3P38DRAFT_2924861, partial [Favolaschia claudopus]